MRLIEQTPEQLARSLRSLVVASILPLNKRGQRDWRGFSAEALKNYARWKIGSEGITHRVGLRAADLGLHEALGRRQLFGEVGFGGGNRNWAKKGKDELVALAKGFVEERGIAGRWELKKADPKLYDALSTRKLMDEVGLEKKFRDLARKDRDGLVMFANEFIAENGITGRGKLKVAYSGLYKALKNKKLLDDVGLLNSNEKDRDWVGMDNDELIARAKTFIAEKGISGRSELKRADAGLNNALRKRKLLDGVGLPNLRGETRNWARMRKDGLVVHAKRFIAERRIEKRGELKEADSGLYRALWKRKLLDTVFSDVESSNHKEAVARVLDALESFGEEK